MWFMFKDVFPRFNISIIAFLDEKRILGTIVCFEEGQMNDALDFMNN
jgi:hypothetical protein